MDWILPLIHTYASTTPVLTPMHTLPRAHAYDTHAPGIPTHIPMLMTRMPLFTHTHAPVYPHTCPCLPHAYDTHAPAYTHMPMLTHTHTHAYDTHASTYPHTYPCL